MSDISLHLIIDLCLLHLEMERSANALRKIALSIGSKEIYKSSCYQQYTNDIQDCIVTYRTLFDNLRAWKTNAEQDEMLQNFEKLQCITNAIKNFEKIEKTYDGIPTDKNYYESMDYVENILPVLHLADEDLGSVLLEYKQLYHSSYESEEDEDYDENEEQFAHFQGDKTSNPYLLNF